MGVTRAEAERHLAWAKAKAAEVLAADGRHEPLALLFRDGAEPLAVALGSMGSPAAKDASAAALRALARLSGAVGVVVVLEAWMSPPSPARWGLAPSSDPERREALVVSWEFRVAGERAKRAGASVRPFHRVGGRVVLGEAAEWPAMEGRFGDVLG